MITLKSLMKVQSLINVQPLFFQRTVLNKHTGTCLYVYQEPSNNFVQSGSLLLLQFAQKSSSKSMSLINVYACLLGTLHMQKAINDLIKMSTIFSQNKVKPILPTQLLQATPKEENFCEKLYVLLLSAAKLLSCVNGSARDKHTKLLSLLSFYLFYLKVGILTFNRVLDIFSEY